MNDANRPHGVIRFKRAVTFPRFSMEEGERWSFVIFGKWVEHLAAIRAGERFDFAGGQCLAQDVEIIYEGPAGLEHSIAAGWIQRRKPERFSPPVSGKSPIQFIHPDALKTSLQVIALAPKVGLSMEYSRPAALSSDDPRRNIQGGYKTPLCREIEDAMRIPEFMERAIAIAKKKLQLGGG